MFCGRPIDNKQELQIIDDKLFYYGCEVPIDQMSPDFKQMYERFLADRKQGDLVNGCER